MCSNCSTFERRREWEPVGLELLHSLGVRVLDVELREGRQEGFRLEVLLHFLPLEEPVVCEPREDGSHKNLLPILK